HPRLLHSFPTRRSSDLVSPHHGMPAMAHTGTARAAVEALTRELAAEWAGDGVAVAAIALGRFATESLRKYPAELWRRAAASVPRSEEHTSELQSPCNLV